MIASPFPPLPFTFCRVLVGGFFSRKRERELKPAHIAPDRRGKGSATPDQGVQRSITQKLSPPVSTRYEFMSKTKFPEQQFFTLGGRIQCNQCRATSKRTKQRCRAPSMLGNAVCRAHGGLSTGPRTPEGRKHSALAITKNGLETRAARAERAVGMRRLRELEELGHRLGIMTGPRTPGRKPLEGG